MQAQEELLAGVAKSAQRGDARVLPDDDGRSDAALQEEVEPYDRSMSPALLDIRKLHHEDREIDIVTELEDLRALVSLPSYCIMLRLCHVHYRWNNAGP